MFNHRKGPIDAPRNDFYIYGIDLHHSVLSKLLIPFSGQAVRYRSAEEFLPHAWWLQQDPSSPCGCGHHPEVLLRPRPRSRKKRAKNGPRISNTTTDTHSKQTIETPATIDSHWTCLEDSVTHGLSPSADSTNAPGNDDSDELDELDELDHDELDELNELGMTDSNMSNGSDDSAEMKEMEDCLLDVKGLDSDDE
jgi:hypothetical protein